MTLAVVMVKNCKWYYCVGHIEEKNVTIWSPKRKEATTFNDAEKAERYVRIYLSNRDDVTIQELE